MLRVCGRTTVEELVRTHLRAEASSEAFWQRALAPTLAAIDEFLALAGGAPSASMG
jgi:hypothetical protein